MNEVNGSQPDQAGQKPPPPPPSPPARPEKGGRARSRYGCFATGLMVVGAMVILSFLLFFGLFLLAIAFGSGETKVATRFSFAESDELTEETVVGIPGIDQKIAVIEVAGLIAYGSRRGDAHLLAAQIRRALRDPQVVAVVLDIDSPGGELTAVDELHYLLRELPRRGKPLVAVMRSMAASGGYYLALACDHIVASPLTITGSVGVIIPRFEYSQLLDRVGIEYAPYKSGQMKDLLSGGVEREPEQRERIDQHLQTIVDEGFMRFAEAVAWSRNDYESAAAVIDASFGDGRILSGSQALQLGLIDELGHFEDAMGKARQLARVEKANVVRYHRPWRWRDFRFMGGGKGLEFNLLKLEAEPLFGNGLTVYYLVPGWQP